MNRRILKANSITTYDTATLWRALEASSANHQNHTVHKDSVRRWQRAATRLLRQNTITSISSQNDNLSRSSSGIGFAGVGGNGLYTSDASDSNERPESNLAFVRRKCDEWLLKGIPKLAQLQNYQFQIDECDLKIEKEWQPFLNEQARSLMSESIKLQQEAIYEMLSTEVSYIRQILTMTDIFMTSVMILKSSQRDGLLNDIEMEKLFSNIKDVLNANLSFWKEILLPIKIKLEQTGCAMNPSDLKLGFIKFDIYFKSYLRYVLDQKASAEYFKQKLAKDDLFQYLIAWIEANFTNRLSFPDLTIKPLQRLTQYKLLLEAIQKRTQDNQQRNDLQEMIQKVASFVNRVNSKLHSQEQEERVRQISDRIGPFECVSAPPEITSILQECYRDSFSHRLDLLRDMPLFVRGYRRQIVQQGPMKMKDAKNSQDVYCYLFTDMFLITKGGKRSGATNLASSTPSSLTSISNDGQFNRGAPTTINKILKPPIRIDRMDVREYDRRGSSGNEPNTASFVALVFSEYNLIECGYLFQTNLSKQWIENIRATKANFQLLMEESKMKLQNAHNNHSTAAAATTTTTTSTSTLATTSSSTLSIVHQSLPSLSSTSETSLDLPALKIGGSSIDSSSTDEPIVNVSTENIRRSSKTESEVFKTVEQQARRNSRTDHKNYGRYFTADGTGTHGTNPSSSSSLVNPSSIKSTPSTAIIKRMSWNNEPINTNNSTTIPTNELSNTNSFRSVHSSSGVSSTGSFLFSADEESSITAATSSSIALIGSSTKAKTEDLTDEHDEFDGKSSSSTVVGTDDHEHLSNSLASHEQSTSSLVNLNNLMRSDMSDNNNNNNSQQLANRLSTSSTNTLTSTTNPSINELTPLINSLTSSPETSLRRTPYASVKKRNQNHLHHRSGLVQQQNPFRRHRIFDENDLRSSTHTVVYDSSKAINTSTAIPIRRAVIPSDDSTLAVSSFGGSGNESDYDNHHSSLECSKVTRYLTTSTRFFKIPVNNFDRFDELTRTDDLILGDQNEIVLHNDSNIHTMTNYDTVEDDVDDDDEQNDDNNNNDDDDHSHNADDKDLTEARVELSDDHDNDDDDIDGDEKTIQSTIVNNNQPSDSNIILPTNSRQPASTRRATTLTMVKPAKTTTLDDSAPSKYAGYPKDPLAARKLLDIRSHLLLNTTLDATEV
ncbi:unnamed protein product [Rotaria magnacalcarata]|uniref:DH domain-containing protein n=2 Tax=Rotaria magnacalcarata TaxID=392030 RepID=A0A816LZ90_9BILA|nr:unnamed protein product [Rotaria magnacalcarata]CAF2098291.1 unnamed protein product [Rotaria magnacalcarata]